MTALNPKIRRWRTFAIYKITRERLESSASNGRPVSVFFRDDVESAFLTNAPSPTPANVR